MTSLNVSSTELAYSPSSEQWDAYSESFLSVMPSRMLELNQHVAGYTQGHVVDFGCGAGKIIPFVMERKSVLTYTGIDASEVMVSRARGMCEQFGCGRAQILHSTIEDVELSQIDTAISINSYYVWSDTTKVLQQIFIQMPVSSRFVLATINRSLDMPALLEEAEKELYAHPHWQGFKAHNMSISTSTVAKLVTLDALIEEVRSVGFAVLEANQHLYQGGLSLLVLTKNR